MRRYRCQVGFVLSLLLTCSSCTIFGPDVVESFELTEIGGRPLPANYLRTVIDGVPHGFQLEGSRLVLQADHRFRREVWTSSTRNSVPIGSARVARIEGTYTEEGSTITLSYDTGGTVPDTWSYQRLAGGSGIQGEENNYFYPHAVLVSPVTYRISR